MSVLVYTYYILYTIHIHFFLCICILAQRVFRFFCWKPVATRPLGEALSIASSPWCGHDWLSINTNKTPKTACCYMQNVIWLTCCPTLSQMEVAKSCHICHHVLWLSHHSNHRLLISPTHKNCQTTFSCSSFHRIMCCLCSQQTLLSAST